MCKVYQVDMVDGAQQENDQWLWYSPYVYIYIDRHDDTLYTNNVDYNLVVNIMRFDVYIIVHLQKSYCISLSIIIHFF